MISTDPCATSIFPRFTLDRAEFDWASQLRALTPVHRAGELTFKREDTFAPLGYGGVNGAKLRNHIFLAARRAARQPGSGVLYGVPVASPQIPMLGAVARHFGLRAVLALGASNPRTAIRHETVRAAAWAGARFDFGARVAYGPALHARQRELLEGVCRGFLNPPAFYVESAAPPVGSEEARELVEFHDTAALQVASIPEHITDLVIPCGSGNSTVGILHGLVQSPPPGLRDVHLIGIGPSKLEQIEARLRFLGVMTGTDYGVFDPQFDSELPLFHRNRQLYGGEPPRYRLHFEDLHGQGLVRYDQKVPFRYEGVEFHPTYEGKAMRHLTANRPELLLPTTLFWVVGSEPSLSVLAPYLERFCGPCPTEAPEVDA